VAAATTFAVGKPPAAPAGLLAVAASATQVNLTWTDKSSNETGFVIDRSANGGATWTRIQQTVANVVAYSDTTALANTSYMYRVRAISATGFSGAIADTVSTPASFAKSGKLAKTLAGAASQAAADAALADQVWLGTVGNRRVV
jgi:hypothetical protein